MDSTAEVILLPPAPPPAGRLRVVPWLAAVAVHAIALGVGAWVVAAPEAEPPGPRRVVHMLASEPKPKTPPPLDLPAPPMPVKAVKAAKAELATPRLPVIRRAARQALAAGRRRAVILAPSVAAPPSPDEVPMPNDVVLPAADGNGADGDALAGDGQRGGGGGDEVSHARPPMPLEATRRANVPYTRDAIEAHVGGVVLVDVLVNVSGGVDEVKLHQALGYGLDPLALARARSFRFLPALDAAGRPVAQWIVWEFVFRRPGDSRPREEL